MILITYSYTGRPKGLVINYGEGGYKMGKLRVRNFKLYAPPPPTITMAKTSSSCVKTTSKLVLFCPLFRPKQKNSCVLVSPREKNRVGW